MSLEGLMGRAGKVFAEPISWVSSLRLFTANRPPPPIFQDRSF